MAVYRFKVFIEDSEDVFRDIEIKAAQTFEDFHRSIQEAFRFDAKHAASFFVSDDYWRKGQEITLRREDLPLDDEEVRNNIAPKRLMKETKIATFIDDPHQRFVYVFDPEAQWTFLIEMMKIVEESRKLDYPAVIKSVGAAPRQYKQAAVPKADPDADPIAALLGDVEEMSEEDDEVLPEETVPVEVGVEDEDISALEGEEGEEDDAAEDDGDEFTSDFEEDEDR